MTKSDRSAEPSVQEGLLRDRVPAGAAQPGPAIGSPAPDSLNNNSVLDGELNRVGICLQYEVLH